MGSTLQWEPVIRKGKPLPDELKRIIKKTYQNMSGQEMGHDDRAYVQALVDADIPGAVDLLKALVKHGNIILTEVY